MDGPFDKSRWARLEVVVHWLPKLSWLRIAGTIRILKEISHAIADDENKDSPKNQKSSKGQSSETKRAKQRYHAQVPYSY
jgi:hypothetical protein